MWTWRWKTLTQVGSLSLAVYIFATGWNHLGPRKPEVGLARRQVVEQIMPQVVEDIRLHRQNVRSAVLLHLHNDYTDVVTDQLRDRVERTGVLDLHDRAFLEKVRRVMRLRHPSVGDLESALTAARRRGVDAVLFGRVDRFETTPSGVSFELEVTLADVATRQPVFSKRYEKNMAAGPFSHEAVREQVRSIQPAKRFLSWVVIVLLLPVFTISFIRTMVRKGSNRANAATLSIYTLVDALLAYLLIGAALTGWFSVMLFVIAVGAALAYNIQIMSFALRLEE